MNLDCYTQYIPLTSKARFWGNFVSALKGLTALKLWLHDHWPHSNSGSNDLYASPVPHVRTYYPSIVEALPRGEMKLKHEFGKLEDLMWRNRRGTSLPPTPVLPEANDRLVRRAVSQESFNWDFCSGSTPWATTTVPYTQRYMDLTETGTEELTTNSSGFSLISSLKLYLSWNINPSQLWPG